MALAASLGPQTKCEVCGTPVAPVEARTLDHVLRWWAEIPPFDDVMVLEVHAPERCQEALSPRYAP